MGSQAKDTGAPIRRPRAVPHLDMDMINALDLHGEKGTSSARPAQVKTPHQGDWRGVALKINIVIMILVQMVRCGLQPCNPACDQWGSRTASMM